MKAVVYERYGPPDVLELAEVETPVPGDREILIKIHAASVNRSDWETLIGSPLYARMGGPLRPARPILGSDIAGVVEEVGGAVDAFKPGDEVFGDLMYHGGRAFAEYVAVSADAPIVLKPSNLSFSQAAALPQAAGIALMATTGVVSRDDRVLINGAGGGAGGFAIQLARAAGASVTGVDNSFKQDYLRSVGVDFVVDYTRSDYTRTGRYDFILDLFCQRSMFAVRRALVPGGRYSMVGGSVPALLSAATIGKLLSTDGRKMGVLVVQPDKVEMTKVADLAAEGVLRPSVERTYPLDLVPEALRHLGEGRALGKLVIEIA